MKIEKIVPQVPVVRLVPRAQTREGFVFTEADLIEGFKQVQAHAAEWAIRYCIARLHEESFVDAPAELEKILKE